MYNNFETGLFPSSQPTSSPSSFESIILSIIHLSFYAADKCHADNDPADTASFDYANASKQYCLTGSIEMALAVGVGFFSCYINRSQNNARDQHDIEYESLNSNL